MTAVEENPVVEPLTHPPEQREPAFVWEGRVMGAGYFCALPVALLGVLLRLFIPDGGPTHWWLIGGYVLGAIIGVLLERKLFFG